MFALELIWRWTGGMDRRGILSILHPKGGNHETEILAGLLGEVLMADRAFRLRHICGYLPLLTKVTDITRALSFGGFSANVWKFAL